MSKWQNEMVLIVRHLVNDVDGATYTDTRLQETIVVAAQLMKTELDFDKTYTIDIDLKKITPDPTASVKDDAFVSLTCLKAACIITASEARTHAANGFLVKDGPSTIDTKDRAKSYLDLSKVLCDKYEQAKLVYQAGNARAGEAILTPTTSDLDIGYPGNF